MLTSPPPLAGRAGAGHRGERREGRHVAPPALVGAEAEARLAALEGARAGGPEETAATPGGADVPVGQAVVVALTEGEAVRHGGGGRRLGSPDLQSAVPEDLTESLGDCGLPHCRGLVSPESHLPLPRPASHLSTWVADWRLIQAGWTSWKYQVLRSLYQTGQTGREGGREGVVMYICQWDYWDYWDHGAVITVITSLI